MLAGQVVLKNALLLPGPQLQNIAPIHTMYLSYVALMQKFMICFYIKHCNIQYGVLLKHAPNSKTVCHF